MKYLLFAGLLLISYISLAQNVPGAEDLVVAGPDLSRNWTSIEIVLSVSLLIFALILIGLEVLIIMRATKTWAPRSILRLIGLTLIICVAALLVVAGYGKDQIAPVMGLLGVVAGYLLGANDQKLAT